MSNKNKFDVDIPNEVLDEFARYITPYVREYYKDCKAWVRYREWRLAHGMDDIDVDKEWRNYIGDSNDG